MQPYQNVFFLINELLYQNNKRCIINITLLKPQKNQKNTQY